VSSSCLFNSVNPSSSVCANLRDATPGYNYTYGFLLYCLYLDEDGDAEDPEEGFLKGPLLVHVSFWSSLLQCKADFSDLSVGV